MLVDTHAHVFKVGLPLTKDRRYAPEYDASGIDFINHFTSHELTHGVLIQPSFLGTDNSYMIEVIDQFPEQLYGVAVVEPTISAEELDEMNRHHIIGIRLNLYGRPIPDLTEDKWKSLFKEIKRLDWHVELHADSTVLMGLVPQLLAEDVKVVVDHFGKPVYSNPLDDEGMQYLLSIGHTGKVWIKISGVYPLDNNIPLEERLHKAEILTTELLKVYGPQRLLWGSDWPHTQFESAITYDLIWQVLTQIVPDEATRNMILGTSFTELLSK